MNIETPFQAINDAFQVLALESSQGISVADLAGNYVFVNPAFCQMMGYSQNELLNMTVLDITAPEREHSSFEQIKSVQENTPVRIELKKKDGTNFISEVIRKNISIGGENYVLGTVQDISNRLKTEQALLDSEKRNSLIVQIANDGVWDWRLDTNYVEFDERYYTMAGYEKGEFPCCYNEWEKRVHPDDVAHTKHNIHLHITGKSNQYDVEFRFLCKNNHYMWIRGQGKVVEYNRKGEPLRFIGTHSDITVQKKHEEKILHQAHFDSLTLLPNRFLSLDRLDIACKEAKRNDDLVALLFLDLDDFKKINDTLGHDVGDQLLIDAANRLRSIVRSNDTVGRLGGDEFIIILGGLKHPQEAQPIVENLLNQFRKMFVINSRELLLTTSVGVAIYPNDAHSAFDLLRKADSAMYDAKECGRNTYSYYTDEMNLCAQRRLAIEEQLHGALVRNEFSIHYQAKISFANAKIMGAEALLRWHNPILGNVPPDEFIPIAEQTGIIIDLGQFVLKQSLTQTAIWQAQFQNNFEIAVNLSPRQFRDLQLVDFIKDSLKKANIPASSLELEITEGVLLSGQSHAKQVLTSLKEFGIKIAMDDFGTGYSSLSYLRNYPFDVLKIDRSFINDMTSTRKDKALINAVIAMSHALDIKVVAEGIETNEQFELLRMLGCDYGQGYLFSKPLAANKMTQLLKDSQSVNFPFEI